METLDLLLKPQGDKDVLVLLIGPGLQTTFTVTPQPRLESKYKAWLGRFIAHHDQSGTTLPAHVLQHYRDQLLAEMEEWLAKPEWFVFSQALVTHQQLPIRIGIDPSLPELIRLPWECLYPDRLIWRIQQSKNRIFKTENIARKPRLLLLVGDEHTLDLSNEINRLEALQRSGSIALTVLRKERCNAAAIRSTLAQSYGWDALLFLGHSEADSTNGGRLHLGDNSFIAAKSLDQDLKKAAAQGLQLVLLNSCSGMDWAESALNTGVCWAICFREAVPSSAAAKTFEQILIALEEGKDLIHAVYKTRTELVEKGESGTALLLTALSNTSAEQFSLPLRKRRQFLLRLSRSSRSQALTATAFAIIGLYTDIIPWNPVNQGLLNQRLRLQRMYRDLTNQPGPTIKPLPVLLLEKRRAYPQLNVRVNPETTRISRQALLQILLKTPPEKVPHIGMDLILDEPEVEVKETKLLAKLIKKQKRSEVFAGYYGATTDGLQAGSYSEPIELLKNAGLKSYDLAVNTDPGWWSTPKQRQAPLQLKETINDRYFAHALAGSSAQNIPADAIIDWSLNWGKMIERVNPKQLGQLNSESLLIGTDGLINPAQPDLFDPPAAAIADIQQWELPTKNIPGAMVQGILAQSIKMKHWLTPASLFITSISAAGLGVVAAAGIQSKKKRLAIVITGCAALTAFSFQWTISSKHLSPILIPAAALIATSLIRED